MACKQKKFNIFCDFFIVNNHGFKARLSPRFISLLIRLDWLSGQHPIDLSCGRSSRNRLTVHRAKFFPRCLKTGPENKAVNYLRRCIWKRAVQYRASSWPRENWKENKSTISVINWLNMERQNEWNHSPNNEALKKIINDRFVLFNTQASGLKAKKTVDE